MRSEKKLILICLILFVLDMLGIFLFVSNTAAIFSVPYGSYGRKAAGPIPDSGRNRSGDEVNFADIRYERPDTEAMKERLLSLFDTVSQDADTDMLINEYEAVLADIDTVDTMCVYCDIMSRADVTDEYYSEEYLHLAAELSEMDLMLTELTIKMFETENIGSMMRSSYGEDFEQYVYFNERLGSSDIQEESRREQELIEEYGRLITTFTFSLDERRYSYDDLLDFEIRNEYDYDRYLRAVSAYYTELNDQAGQLFSELKALREGMAKKLGYDSFADYRYDCCMRDFSPEEAKIFEDHVKEYIVPLYVRTTVQTMYGEEAGEISSPVFMDQLKTAVNGISPELVKPLEFMLRNDMYMIGSGKNMMDSCFSTFLSDYSSPFLFVKWDGYDISGIIHEFGHYSRFYMNRDNGWGRSGSLDLDEIDSQGLEMLMSYYYEAFYGSGAADLMRLHKINDFLYVFLAGCMEDEFQQAVYADPDMTLSEMNELYGRLEEEYGFAETSGAFYPPEAWVTVPHTFESPFYYISYAASISAVFELWETSLEDPGKAARTYMDILNRPDSARLREFTGSAGMRDPVSPGTVIEIGKTLERWLDENYPYDETLMLPCHDGSEEDAA